VIEELNNGNWRVLMNENKELYDALSRAQGKVENAKKLNKNPHFKSNYADLATIWDVIREPLTSEGLSVLQLPCEAPAGNVGLLTILGHKSGQSVAERFFLALKDSSNPQQAGSAFTYMKRYALLGVAGIASEDDDGNAAAGKPSPAPASVDYSATIAETMKQLEGATDEEARMLYATVRNSGMHEVAKTGLLKQMFTVIQARTKKESK
jgi:hypothetical protein